MTTPGGPGHERSELLVHKRVGLRKRCTDHPPPNLERGKKKKLYPALCMVVFQNRRGTTHILPYTQYKMLALYCDMPHSWPLNTL